MAGAMDTTVSNYQHMEHGTTFPQPQQVEQLRLVYGVDYNYVFCGSHAGLPIGLVEKLNGCA